MKFVAFAIFFLFYLGFIVAAAPSFFSVTPTNNSYTRGTDSDIFSTSITDSNLNASTVYLHVRVEDPTSVWSNISMSSNCYNTSSSDWNCNTSVPGLSALARDGNFLLFYFDAYSNNGGYGNNGTAEGPNRVRIDRSGPIINFTNPVNNSYTSGNLTIKMYVADEISGTNASTANYSFDNSSWLPTSKTGSIFTALQQLDTTVYTNNQTITIYAKAADNLGNINYRNINATIDNEIPRLTVLSPTNNQALYDDILLSFSSEESYSGLDNKTAICSISGSSNTLSCNGTDYKLNCSATFNTKSVNDNPYNLTCSIKDRASNLAQSNVSVVVDNQPPVISIVSPSNNAQISGIVTLNTTTTDAGIGVSNVSYRLENTSTSGNWALLTCSGSLRSTSCSGTWNSNNYANGIYTIRFNAYDLLSRQATDGVTVRLSHLSNMTTTTTATTTTIVTTTTIANQTITDSIKDFLSKITKGILPSPTNTGTSEKSWLPIIVVIVIVLAIVLVYFFWPKQTSVYPGYKPKKSF